MMGLIHYLIDLRSASPDERARILEAIETHSFSGVSLTNTQFVFTFFLDGTDDINQIPGLPVHWVQRLP